MEGGTCVSGDKVGYACSSETRARGYACLQKEDNRASRRCAKAAFYMLAAYAIRHSKKGSKGVRDVKVTSAGLTQKIGLDTPLSFY